MTINLRRGYVIIIFSQADWAKVILYSKIKKVQGRSIVIALSKQTDVTYQSISSVRGTIF